ncbi:MAG: asparagine synthase (glutamine-hydrolyzing) [Saprospiraceae bacterium]
MCGIAAILTPVPDRQAGFLDRAIHLLQHRGPDGQGRWQDATVGLAHTRLAILDLSEAGAQPMRSDSGHYVITYNGEIYNHLELRQKHFQGRRWRGHADTETLLALFEKLGTAMFAELVGMWAMAIWDTEAQRLLISRDRYGQKPLYYRFYPEGSFALSSEIKSLLLPGQKNPVNPLMAAEYLALGNYGHLGEQTFFAEVEQLLPGHFAWVQAGDQSLYPQAYWRLPCVSRKDKIFVGPSEIAQLREVLLKAVRSQTLSDVPIGATLSGGLDSSLVTGILAAKTFTSQPLNIFTAQSLGSRWDESVYVQAVHDKWGARIRLHSKDLNQIRISEHLERTLWIQEEPFGDPSIIAHGFLMDMAKDAGIKVVLGGQGADEVFRGYPHSIQQLFAHELSHFNLRYALPEMRQAGLYLFDWLRILLGAYFPSFERALRMHSRAQRRSFLSPALQEAAQGAGKHDLPLANDWEAAMAESLAGVHIPHLVHYDDRNGMARSIEGRMPFLDHRLLELTAAWKPQAFYQRGFSKSLIRQAGKEFLPEAVINRRDKIGFFTPLFEMLRQEIGYVHQLIECFSWVDKKVLESDIAAIAGNGANLECAQRLWRVACLASWCKRFDVVL